MAGDDVSEPIDGGQVVKPNLWRIGSWRPRRLGRRNSSIMTRSAPSNGVKAPACWT